MVSWLFDVLDNAPDADAIVTDTGRWTRAQLRTAAERLAADLVRSPARSRPRSPSAPIDPSSPRSRRSAAAWPASRCGTTTRSDPATSPAVRARRSPTARPRLRPARPSPGSTSIIGPARLRPPGTAGPPPGAQIFATSGSTGAPAGVVRRPEAVRSDGGRIATALHRTGARPVLLASPAFHAYGFSHLVSSLSPGRCCATAHRCPARPPCRGRRRDPGRGAGRAPVPVPADRGGSRRAAPRPRGGRLLHRSPRPRTSPGGPSRVSGCRWSTPTAHPRPGRSRSATCRRSGPGRRRAAAGIRARVGTGRRAVAVDRRAGRRASRRRRSAAASAGRRLVPLRGPRRAGRRPRSGCSAGPATCSTSPARRSAAPGSSTPWPAIRG